MVKNFSDHNVIDSWEKNVEPWVLSVREGEIQSRVLVTNHAIVDVVLAEKPKTVLDIGCGEGWLVRELAAAGVDTLGIDAIPALIASAEKAGGGRFKVLPIEHLSSQTLGETYDTLVCNFSLLGKECVDQLFQLAPSLLKEGGSMIVQTVHPSMGGGEGYEDAWREESWVGFNRQFSDPAPWYFRTLESWVALFSRAGLKFVSLREPRHPETGFPVSIIFVGMKVSEHVDICR